MVENLSWSRDTAYVHHADALATIRRGVAVPRLLTEPGTVSEAGEDEDIERQLCFSGAW